MKQRKRSPRRTASAKRIAHESEGALSGALAGGVVGAAAGPAGLAAGVAIGSVAGALAGAALDTEASLRAARTRELDAEIGVGDGELGAPNVAHPEAEMGAYSSAPSGEILSDDEAPAEGPFEPPQS